MTNYKVGTRINFNKQAKRQALKDDLINSLFWAGLVLAFFYCLYA